MVHCRSIMGAWRHAQRSFLRGFLSRPPVFSGVELPLPPPPPVFYGVELPEPRDHWHWDDHLLEEEGIDSDLPIVPLPPLVSPGCLIGNSLAKMSM